MKKETKSKDAPKEHKQPWQEKYATPEDIKRMLADRVMLRYNEVRGRTEIHWLSQGPTIREDEQGLLTIFAEEISQSANELIDDNFRKPVGIEGGDYLPASVILQKVGGVSMRELSAAAIGHALTAMGFEYKLIHGIRRYRVVSLTDAEKKQYRHLPDEGGEGGEVE